MTLVTSYSVSGNFAIMTSDTRRVNTKYWFDVETKQYEPVEDAEKVISDEKSIKTHQLTGYVLAGAGGIAELSMYIIEKLKAEVSWNDDLADCKKALDRVIERERKNPDAPNFVNFLNQKDGVTVALNGFYSDASTGLVYFESGKDTVVSETKAPKGKIQYSMITPAKEYMRQSEALFNIPEFQDAAFFEGLTEKETNAKVFQAAIDRLATIHAVISYHQKVEVSPDAEFHVLQLDETGTIQYGKNDFDFNEWHADYDRNK